MFGSSKTGAKPTAALSSSLLARKGQARPAMRPQGVGGFNAPSGFDDLGWNDMGEDAVGETVPPVLLQREALAEEFGGQEPADVPAAPEPTVSVSPAAAIPLSAVVRIERARGAVKAKVAFTLRLDAQRHLRLRLASAVQRQSSQAVVTAALDAFLTTLPEVEALARQLPEPAPARKRKS